MRRVRHRLVVDDPIVDSTACEGTQLPVLDTPAATEQVRRDAVQPWQDAAGRATGRASLKRERERLSGELIGKVATCSSMEVPVDSIEVAIEEQRELRRVGQRPSKDFSIGRTCRHQTVCARRAVLAFKSWSISRQRLSLAVESP